MSSEAKSAPIIETLRAQTRRLYMIYLPREWMLMLQMTRTTKDCGRPPYVSPYAFMAVMYAVPQGMPTNASH